VEAAVTASVLRPLDAYESARRELWDIVRDAGTACGRGDDPARTQGPST
jgi:hypothetical protein